MIKILMGGSPCTHWSAAQKNNRETEPEGLGWELFKNYLITKEKYKPDYFLYENNKSAAQPIKDQISKELGVDLQYINSALVSAQNRQRFYAHNIPNVPQPEDKGILLRDIIESGYTDREKSYTICTNIGHTTSGIEMYKRSARQIVFDPVCVAQRGMYTGADGVIQQHYEARNDGKTNVITTVQKDNMICESVRVGHFNKGGQGDRIYSIAGKSVCLSANGGGRGKKTGLYAIPVDGSSKGHEVYTVENGMITDGEKQYEIKLPDGYYIIRKLTISECKRLQTVPDNYIMPCSDAQNYKMLGNGWTVDVIAHILSHIPNLRNEPIEVLSMYDGMSCGHIALDRLGADITRYFATEIDKYAIQTTMANYPDTIQLGDAFCVREEWWLSGKVQQNEPMEGQMEIDETTP